MGDGGAVARGSAIGFRNRGRQRRVPWRQLMAQSGVGPSSWTDAYLAAFSEAQLILAGHLGHWVQAVARAQTDSSFVLAEPPRQMKPWPGRRLDWLRGRLPSGTRGSSRGDACHRARIQSAGDDPLAAEVATRRAAERAGKVFISLYNDADVIAGQGTIAI